MKTSNATAEIPTLLTVEEARKALRMGNSRFYQRLKEPDFLKPHIRIGRRQLFRAEDVQDYIARNALAS